MDNLNHASNPLTEMASKIDEIEIIKHQGIQPRNIFRHSLMAEEKNKMMKLLETLEFQNRTQKFRDTNFTTEVLNKI